MTEVFPVFERIGFTILHIRMDQDKTETFSEEQEAPATKKKVVRRTATRARKPRATAKAKDEAVDTDSKAEQLTFEPSSSEATASESASAEPSVTSGKESIPDSGSTENDSQSRDQHEGDSSEEAGERSGGRRNDRRGSDRGRGGFRKKFKKGENRGRRNGGGRGRQKDNNRPDNGWAQPLPPEEQAKIFGELPDLEQLTNLEELADEAKVLSSGSGEPIFLDEYSKMSIQDLTDSIRAKGIEIDGKPGRNQLMKNLFAWAVEQQSPVFDRGFLDLNDDGYGFVVHPSHNYKLMPESSLISNAFVKEYGLKRGHEVEVQVRPPVEKARCPSVLLVKTVMGESPESISSIEPFEELIPYYPLERIFLEVDSDEANQKDVSMRAFDILSPIGLGQRGLIVAPPRTGKTIILQGIAHSVATNHPEAELIVLLIDERPEEVTDFRRRVKGEVVSSSFDESPESHVHAAEMVIEKARRAVEKGRHVVILLDSITRLARAYNALASNSGKIMSGGIEATALQKPKRFFGAARNIEGAGSLTIMGTALVDTGSRMDEVIFEEFKGTGNMEIHLDRDLVNKRIFPAINFAQSGTRKEELLYHPQEIEKIYSLRRAMQGVPPVEAMEMLIKRLRKTKSNAEFLMSLK
ncbi:MAG: transcription termination factor Rho [Opitutaceae bacterium]|nr:transcription termination factor Rho [Opitutaceae bacterium]